MPFAYGVVRVEVVEPVERGGSDGEDQAGDAVSAAAGEDVNGGSVAGGVPVDLLAGEEVHVVESAGIVVVVGAANFALEFDARAVGQIGKCGSGFESVRVKKERHLGAGAGREFDGEALAVGRDESGIHDAAFEDGGHIIADAERGRRLGRAGSGEGDRAEDESDQATRRRQGASNARARR